MKTVDDRLARLECRLAELEDLTAIYQIMAAYGPLVDSGDAEATAALWTEDGIYDWGGGTAKPGEGMKEGAAGAAHNRGEIEAMVRGAYHQAIIHGGAGHVIGMPHVKLSGDTAVAVSYSQLCRRDGDNFRVWRVGANVWEFVRTAAGWRVTRRVNRVMTGEDGPRELMRAVLVGL